MEGTFGEQWQNALNQQSFATVRIISNQRNVYFILIID
jgi:hypothetical protein